MMISIQPMNDMDTTTFLDIIKNNCLMEYLQYTNLKTDKTTDNMTDIMIAVLNSVESPLCGQKHFLALPNTFC